MTDFINGLAEQDFYKAKTRALLSRLYHLFKPEDEDLLPFEEAKKLLSPGGEVYTGVTAVPLDRIVGSEGRYRDFNRHFLPKKEHLRQRWISVDKTRYTDVILPPVRLYEMGGVYFVRDGNHRVSVARSMGQIEIDAEVISLQSKIGILPDATIDEVKQAVIAYEKAIFEEQTHYGTVIGHDDLDFSEPGRYETIQEHINVHKYYLNEHQPVEISFPSALWSWHENVYSPVVLAIREERLLTLFPGRTEGDLYLYLVRHWHELKYAHKQEIGIGDAARDFRQRAGATIPSFFRSLLEKCQKWFGRGDLFKK